MSRILAIALLSGTAWAEEGPTVVAYDLDPNQSHLDVVVRPDTSGFISRTMGSDHVITATGWNGTVRWDPEDPSACQVEITVPVAGLTVDPPGSRDRAGLDGDGAGSNAPQILENIMSQAQLYVERFPQISYRSNQCSEANGQIQVAGELNIRGASQTIELPMQIRADDSSFHAQGTFTANHTDFGFEPFTNVMGALRNDDELEFLVDVRGRATEPPEVAGED